MKAYPELKPMYCYPDTSFESHYGRQPKSVFELQDHFDAYSSIWINDYIITSVNYPLSGTSDKP